MNLILVERQEVDNAGRVLLSDRRAEHLRKVLRVQIGQELRAGIVCGPLAVARVLSIGEKIALQIEERGNAAVPWLDLVIALPRPKALPRIIQSAASFGVRRIDIINAWRVDAAYFASPKLAPDLLRLEALLGCEQGGQVFVPEVGVHRFFAPFVDGELRQRLAERPQCQLIVAHPAAPQAIEVIVPPGTESSLVLVLGPDGGFITREIESLVAVGAMPAHFGHAVLRSEVAAVAILSQLTLLRRLAPHWPG